MSSEADDLSAQFSNISGIDAEFVDDVLGEDSVEDVQINIGKKPASRKSTTGFGPFDTTDGKPVPPQCTVDTYWIAGLLAFLSFKRDTNGFLRIPGSIPRVRELKAYVSQVYADITHAHSAGNWETMWESSLPESPNHKCWKGPSQVRVHDLVSLAKSYLLGVSLIRPSHQRFWKQIVEDVTNEQDQVYAARLLLFLSRSSDCYLLQHVIKFLGIAVTKSNGGGTHVLDPKGIILCFFKCIFHQDDASAALPVAAQGDEAVAACFDNAVGIAAATLLAHNYSSVVDARKLFFRMPFDDDSDSRPCTPEDRMIEPVLDATSARRLRSNHDVLAAQIDEELAILNKKNETVQQKLEEFAAEKPKPNLLTPRKRRAWNAEKKAHMETQKRVKARIDICDSKREELLGQHAEAGTLCGVKIVQPMVRRSNSSHTMSATPNPIAASYARKKTSSMVSIPCTSAVARGVHTETPTSATRPSATRALRDVNGGQRGRLGNKSTVRTFSLLEDRQNVVSIQTSIV
eukprot:m.59445 g.59445  ORF g.59445 m.59445 type:complete len:517 (-) comp15698_c0_seq3:310-1860(-)